MDKNINQEIENMAEKMEKSSQEPQERLFAIIKSLGPVKLKQKLETLTDDEIEVLKAALEEMTLQKAVSFDKEAQAPVINGKVADTIIQEEVANDDADEKLVKPTATKMDHQGTPTEGWEGQVIKADEKYSMPKKEAIEEHKRLVNVLESDDKNDDKQEAKKQKKELKEMKKSEIELIEENLDEVIEKAMAKCNDENMVAEKLEKKGMDKAKVQGALDKFKKKKDDVKKSEDLEKGKMKEKEMDKDEAKEKKVANKMTEAMDEMAEDEAKEEVKEHEEKMHKKDVKKSITWEDDNALLKANTLGRNFNFNVETFINETLAKGEVTEEVKKSNTKNDLNDLIAKSEDRSWDQVKTQRNLEAQKQTGQLVKSFADSEIAAALGLTEEEAKKLLGE